jgi:hypothetical protein
VGKNGTVAGTGTSTTRVAELEELDSAARSEHLLSDLGANKRAFVSCIMLRLIIIMSRGRQAGASYQSQGHLPITVTADDDVAMAFSGQLSMLSGQLKNSVTVLLDT